jgi:hypothetical protein
MAYVLEVLKSKKISKKMDKNLILILIILNSDSRDHEKKCDVPILYAFGSKVLIKIMIRWLKL